MEVACEQALCLEKEWKNHEESEGKGCSPRDFSIPSSNKELAHRLTGGGEPQVGLKIIRVYM